MQMKVKNLFKEKKKSANESSESRTNRLATQSRYQRQKFANELAQCSEERLFNQRQYQKEDIKNGSVDHIRQERLLNQLQYQKKKLKIDQQTILVKRDWQTSIYIRMRKMHIHVVQLLLMKSENFMLLSKVYLLFIN